jgi:GNAT superfamily N-acetyltransferase
MAQVTYKMTKAVPARAVLALFRRNEWREWFSLRDTQDLLDSALFVATAWHGQRAIGIATLYGDRRFYTRLDTLLVDEDWRRNGIGTRLIQLVMDKVNQLKPHYCELDTHADWLVAFYKRFGFEVAEDLLLFHKPTEEYLDAYVQSQCAVLNKQTDSQPSIIDDALNGDPCL